MSLQNDSQTNPAQPQADWRTCPKCGQHQPPPKFYPKRADCRSCILLAANIGLNKKTLDEVLAERRVMKLTLKAERAEALKLAKARRSEQRKKRLRKTQAAKKAALMPAAPVEELIVDPVAKEMAARVLARRRLIEFTQMFHPNYKAGWVHHDICRRLEKFAADVEAEKSPRLMIMMPPRHGKSELASTMYPAWHLGHHPEHEFISCSYNLDLALKFSRRVRAIVREDRYGKIFERTRLDPDVQSAESWKLTEPGGFVAAGIGGGITGKGAHVLVIDDPIKNDKEADSADVRQGIFNWYQATAYTRLAPGGGVLIIQTCWHDDDLAGRLQKDMLADPEADQFEIVKYPAIAEEDEEFRLEGDPLHEARYDYDALMRIKRNLAKRYWSALYQQSPVPEEGAYFTKSQFKYRTEEPDPNACLIYQTWDFAISEKQQNDYTVGTCGMVDYDDTLHVVDRVRFRSGDAYLIVEAMIDLYVKWDQGKGRVVIGVEDGQIWRTLKAVFDRRCKERKVYPTVDDPLQPVSDKQVRARPLQGRMQQGKVTFRESTPHHDAAEREKLRFPSGEFDDTIDSEAWLAHLVLKKAPPARPKRSNYSLEKTLDQKMRALMGGAKGRGHMAA